MQLIETRQVNRGIVIDVINALRDQNVAASKHGVGEIQLPWRFNDRLRLPLTIDTSHDKQSIFTNVADKRATTIEFDGSAIIDNRTRRWEYCFTGQQCREHAAILKLFKFATSSSHVPTLHFQALPFSGCPI